MCYHYAGWRLTGSSTPLASKRQHSLRLKEKAFPSMPLARSPRVNVSVSDEQHALLLELAELDPDTRSASSFLRDLLDQVTPLLRKTVPMMRAAAQEMDQSREGLREPLRNFLAEIQQLDLIDAPDGAPDRTAAKRGPDRRTARRTAKRPLLHSQGQ